MSSVCKKPRRRKQKTPKTWRSDCVSNLKSRFSHAFISASYKKKVKTYLKCGKIASQYSKLAESIADSKTWVTAEDIIWLILAQIPVRVYAHIFTVKITVEDNQC